MSCGCGCCPKCGCRATCTCNNSLWSLESRSDFSCFGNPTNTTVAEVLEEQCTFNGDNEHSSGQSECSGAGAYAKKGRRATRNTDRLGANHDCSAGTCSSANE